MVTIHPKFVIDEKARKKAVILPFCEWQSLMDELAELEDIRSYDKAKAKRESVVPFEAAIRQIKSRIKK
jgi:hypothetical protein